jgi:hypothetical protein
MCCVGFVRGGVTNGKKEYVMDRREIRSDVRLETHMDEFVSRCGYCGDVIDYCQGHGEDERAEFGVGACVVSVGLFVVQVG